TAVPAVVAGRGGIFDDRQQATGSEFAKVLASKGPRSFADKFDIAECAATERIDTARPPLRRSFDCVDNVIFQLVSPIFPVSRHCDARKSDTWRPVTPLARPGRLPFAPQIRPVVAVRCDSLLFQGHELSDCLARALKCRHM